MYVCMCIYLQVSQPLLRGSVLARPEMFAYKHINMATSAQERYKDKEDWQLSCYGEYMAKWNKNCQENKITT
jgi:hypothetical protein